MSITRDQSVDLCAAREAIRQGRSTAIGLLQASITAADADASRHSFIRRFDSMARTCALAVDAVARSGAPLPPLAGLSVSIKDLFDVHGVTTTAGSRVLQDEVPAASDAPVVARLRAAGAALIGHTNLSEFAYSGVGINPHHGTPANPATRALDPTPRIPGGSTSGGAVSVASGAAWVALGSDTGGSIRIPAALQGLVGFKNTQRLTPLQGSVPLSSTLDTACAITRSVRDAVLTHEILAQRQVQVQPRPLSRLHFAVPTTLMLDALEPSVAHAFERSLKALRAAGATVTEIALPELLQLAGLYAQGGFAAAESWAWHRARLKYDDARYDPRVAMRIRRGEAIGAADYIELLAARCQWIASVAQAAAGFDALISPTVPMVAPVLAPLIADDTNFFATNGLLLRNPSVVNFLDGCALSLPCHRPDELPVGLMLWSAAMQDDTVLSAGLAVETALQTSRGA